MPDTRISIHQDQQIMKNIIQFSQNPHVAIDSGQQARISTYGYLGFTLMCCKNFREAVEIAETFWEVTGPMFSYTLLIDDKHAMLRYGNRLYMEENLLRFRTELGFSTLKSLGNQLLKNKLPLAMMHLTYPAPPHYKYYQEIFQCPVLFDQEYNQIIIDNETANSPLPQANPQALNDCLQFCREMMVQLQLEDSLISKVYQRLLQSDGTFPDSQTVADELNLTPRGLHRKLKDLGTSFQQILNRVRKQMAIKYLETTDLPVDKIADLTGYGEASNFRAAFKKWTGKSPNEFRR